jgi:hypothetical protein
VIFSTIVSRWYNVAILLQSAASLCKPEMRIQAAIQKFTFL